MKKDFLGLGKNEMNNHFNYIRDNMESEEEPLLDGVVNYHKCVEFLLEFKTRCKNMDYLINSLTKKDGRFYFRMFYLSIFTVIYRLPVGLFGCLLGNRARHPNV